MHLEYLSWFVSLEISYSLEVNKHMENLCPQCKWANMAHGQELRGFTLDTDFNLQNPEGTFHVSSAIECLCDLAWDTVPLWTSFLPLKKIEDLLSSSRRWLPSLDHWNSWNLKEPKTSAAPGTSLLSPDLFRPEGRGRREDTGGCSPRQVSDIFGIQIILKPTHKGLFLTKQYCAAISWDVNWGILFTLC